MGLTQPFGKISLSDSKKKAEMLNLIVTGKKKNSNLNKSCFCEERYSS